jgi:hypothetical protein
MAMTSAFLLVRSAFGLAAGFLARSAFFPCLAFFDGLRVPFGFAASVAGLLVFSVSIAFSLIGFLLDRVAVVTSITPVRRNCKTNLGAITPMRRNSIMVEGNWRVRSLF